MTIASGPNKRMLRLGTSFSKATVPALSSLLDGHDTLVLDLRGNRGGVFEAGLASAAQFLEKDAPLTTISTRSAPQQVRKTDYTGPFSRTKRPIILLVDQDTASAAELFAAALHYNKKDIALIGACGATHTFGKAKIQRAETLPGGDLLLISYAVYLTPQNPPKDISGYGLSPLDASISSCCSYPSTTDDNADNSEATRQEECLDATIQAAAIIGHHPK